MINSLCQRGIQTLGQTLFWPSLGMFLDEITGIFPKLVLYVYHKFWELTPLRLWFSKLSFWKIQCSIKIPTLCKSDASALKTVASALSHTSRTSLCLSSSAFSLRTILVKVSFNKDKVCLSPILDQSMDKIKKRKRTHWIAKYHCDTIKIITFVFRVPCKFLSFLSYVHFIKDHIRPWSCLLPKSSLEQDSAALDNPKCKRLKMLER